MTRRAKAAGGRWIAAMLCASLLAGPLAAQTGPTPAGTIVANVAQGRWADGDRSAALETNAVRLRIDELLDVTLLPGATGRDAGVIPVTLTNGGNGDEAFLLSASTASPGIRVVGIARDRNGDGRYDPADDALLDGKTPILAAGSNLSLFLLVARDADAGEGMVTLTARAATGAGSPGTMFAGMGDGGGDAVVGRTGAAARLDIAVGPADAVTATQPPAALVKSQSVDGDGTPRPGAIVTYRLDARLPAGTRSAGVADPIPAGTAYVAGSLRLDDRMLSDTRDDDAGRADAAGIAVDLGDAAAAVVRRVTFQVRIL